MLTTNGVTINLKQPKGQRLEVENRFERVKHLRSDYLERVAATLCNSFCRVQIEGVGEQVRLGF